MFNLLVQRYCLVAARAEVLIRALLRSVDCRVDTIAAFLDVNAAVALLEIHSSDARLNRAVVIYVVQSDAVGIEE